jgi:uncharacterized repeat protein (TIGR01451 family)
MLMVQKESPQSGGIRSSAAMGIACFLLAMMAWSSGLSAQGPPKISARAATQMQALIGIKTSRSSVQNKIDSRLFVGLLHLRNDSRLAPLTDLRFVKNEADGRVPVEVVVTSSGGVKTVIGKLKSLGAVVKSKSATYQRVSARVHLEDLETIAAMPEVRGVRQAIPALTQAVNVSQGDATHGAAEARGFFGVTGTGVKVCVLSDGVDSLAALQASGDLPPVVDVLPGMAGAGDEGSAMLEIVHDLAPGAALGFATADIDEATFAQNILDLATAGCKVIVDDVIYLDESPFEDGAVAQAVNTVTASGVLYFSSAGNEGNVDDDTSGTWEGDFLASAATPPVALAGSGPLHDFGDGGQSITVTNAFFNSAILIWAEHYDLVTGNASTDFDLYDMDTSLTTIFDFSINTQDGVGGDDFPIEFIGGDVLSGDQLLVAQFAPGATSSVPMFNLIVFRGTLDDTLATTGATRGHRVNVDAFSVAATPAAASFDGISPNGPFPGLFTAANASEDFTSDGPRRIILDTSGNELTPGNRTSTGGVVRQKPDITAADGVSCAAPGFDPFYGTSAAAPHAAAIAALLKSAVPSLTPAQVRTALISTAIDIEIPGVDIDTGAGIVMTHAALQSVGATPQAFLAAGTLSKTEVAGDGDAFVEIGEDWNLTIPLTNAGGVNATAITAVLTSSTPGVVILSGTSSYPDLAPGALPASLPPIAGFINNAQPFTFTTTNAAACGGFLQFTLTVTYTGGNQSPQTFNFSVQTGSPGTPATFSYTGPAVPIADGLGANTPGTTAVATLPVVSAGNLYSLKASLDGTACDTTAGSTTVGLDHTFVNDLQIDLKSPGGTLVTLINRTDFDGHNFCQVLLDDTAGTNIQTAVSTDAPFTGTWSPANPLAGFGGQAINGTWELHATDFFIGDSGNIRAWSLIATPAVCDAVAVSPVLSATKSVSAGAHNPGDAVTYTIVITNTGTGFQPDGTGDEFTDVLPTQLTVGVPTASSGVISVTGTSPATVHWNGSIPPGGTVTITIPATINTGTGGQTISNQGTVNFDANRDLVNDTSATTTPPGGSGPTTFVAGGLPIAEVPTLSDFGLALLALMMSAIAVVTLRKRRQKNAS